jgi:hypothetical protein
MLLALLGHFRELGDDLWPLASVGGFGYLGQSAYEACIERWGQIVVYRFYQLQSS